MAFTMQDDFWKAANILGDKRDAFVASLCSYAFDGVEPTGDPVVEAIFATVKERIDLSVKRHASGKKGGRACKGEKENEKENENEGSSAKHFEKCLEANPKVLDKQKSGLVRNQNVTELKPLTTKEELDEIDRLAEEAGLMRAVR